MRSISVSKDIIPIVKFKMDISKWFKNIQNTGHPLIITQNGKPAGVLLSPGDYDELVFKKNFIDSVAKGIADAESGNLCSVHEGEDPFFDRRSRR